MNKFVTSLQKVLMPIANKMNKNNYIKAMRDGFMLALPFTMTGSILTALASMPFLADIFSESTLQMINTFVAPSSVYSNSIYSLFVVVGISYSLAKTYGINKIHCAMTALVSMLITIPTSIITESGEVVEGALSHSQLGSSAIFTAMIMAFVITELYRWAVNHKLTINLPSSVPASIQDSFTSFIPSTLCMVFALIICAAFKQTSYGTIGAFLFTMLQQPLSVLGNSPIAAIVAGVLNNIFWFFGLHGQTLVSSIFSPFWKPAAAENIAALAAGKALPNLISSGFVNTWIWFGGWISIPLLIALWLYRKKRKDWKEVMKISAVPGFFNIYEPLMFGLPLVLNPFMLIPMILTPLISGTVGYLVTVAGIVPFSTGIDLPITIPLGLNGILGSNDILTGVIQLLCVPVLVAIWYFFLSVQDKSERESGVYTDEA